MAERRRARGAAVAVGPTLVAVLLGALLAGCASIPTSGPVRAGETGDVSAPERYRVVPAGPVAGAGPVDVVRGFLLAGIGADDDFAVARSFLTAQRRTSWRPTARTVVHAQGTLDLTAPDGAGAAAPTGDAAAADGQDPGPVLVRASAPVTGSVDDRGRYTAAVPGTAVDVDLHLVLERGQWRISDAPDLLLLDEPDFQRTFVLQPIYFADRSSGRMVPDLRWLLDRPSSAGTAVEELLQGPSPELAAAVDSGAPPGAATCDGCVVVDGGTAAVDLPASLQRQPPAALRMLQQQVTATLEALPEVYGVRVSLDGGDLPPAGAPVLGEQQVTGPPVALAGDALQQLAGGQLQPVDGVPPLPGASEPAVQGEQVAVLAAGGTQLLRLRAGTGDAPTVVLTGSDLTPPSLDRYGWAWSTTAASDGTVSAVAPAGQVVAVQAPWLAGRRVVALRVARDGARVAVASTGAAGAPDAVRVDVAGLARSGDGTPRALTAAQAPPTPWLAQVRSLAWVDGDTVAVLGSAVAGSAQAAVVPAGAVPAGAGAPSPPQVWLLAGGRSSWVGSPAAPADPVTVTAGSDRRSLLVGTADGEVWNQAGSRWVPLVAARDPAYPG